VDGQQFIELMDEVPRVVSKTLVEKTELTIYRQNRLKELQGKKHARKRLRPQSGNLGLTKEDAEQAIATKLQKEQEMEKKRANANFMKMWRMERDEVHAKGVAARRAEKARIIQLKELQKTSISSQMRCFNQSLIPRPNGRQQTPPGWLSKKPNKTRTKNHVWKGTTTTL
jgi:hypothetical protein